MEESELLLRVQKASKQVKLFPLPEVTLFPSHGLPLHVFEPRYRELTRDALASDRILAVPRLRPGGAEGTEVFPVFGVGLVADHQELPDGKFNIVVRGVARARLVRDLGSAHAYREAELDILSDDLSDVGPGDSLTLTVCLLELGRRLSHENQVALSQLASLGRDPGRLADLSAAALLSSLQHQRVLTELNVKRRLAFVTQQVAELLVALKPAAGMLPS